MDRARAWETEFVFGLDSMRLAKRTRSVFAFYRVTNGAEEKRSLPSSGVVNRPCPQELTSADGHTKSALQEAFFGIRNGDCALCAFNLQAAVSYPHAVSSDVYKHPCKIQKLPADCRDAVRRRLKTEGRLSRTGPG